MTLKEIEKELKRRGIRNVSFSWAPNARKMGKEKLIHDVEKLLTSYLEGKTRVVFTTKPQ